MKRHNLRKVGVCVLSIGLLTGLAYSVLALVASSEPAYAATCNCTEEKSDADLFCEETYGGPSYHFECAQGGTEYRFRCFNNPAILWLKQCD